MGERERESSMDSQQREADLQKEQGAYVCVCHREGSMRAVYARTRRPLAVSL